MWPHRTLGRSAFLLKPRDPSACCLCSPFQYVLTTVFAAIASSERTRLVTIVLSSHRQRGSLSAPCDTIVRNEPKALWIWLDPIQGPGILVCIGGPPSFFFLLTLLASASLQILCHLASSFPDSSFIATTLATHPRYLFRAGVVADHSGNPPLCHLHR